MKKKLLLSTILLVLYASICFNAHGMKRKYDEITKTQEPSTTYAYGIPDEDDEDKDTGERKVKKHKPNLTVVNTVGIINNFGVTCYLNALLQNLFRIWGSLADNPVITELFQSQEKSIRFKKYLAVEAASATDSISREKFKTVKNDLLENKPITLSKDEIAVFSNFLPQALTKLTMLKELFVIFRQIAATKQGVIDKKEFVAAFFKFEEALKNFHFNAYTHNDPAEAFTHIADVFSNLLVFLHSRSNEQEKNMLPETNLFKTETLPLTTCETCKKTYPGPRVSESFLSIEIEPENKTLNNCLDSFFKQETLTKANKYACENCRKNQKDTKALQNATRKFALGSIGKNLLIQLKRFNPDGSKIDKKISVPKQLNIRDYLDPEFLKLQEARTNTLYNTTYNLVGIIFHSGETIERGHYYAAIKKIDNEWNLCDDSDVSPLWEIQVKSMLDSGTFNTGQAYFLCYEKQDPVK